jgi:hypothetical protein
LLIATGLPFNHTLVWLYVLPPGVLTWLTTRPVIENKRLPELLESPPPLTSSSFHSWAKRATSEHRPVDQVRPPCCMVIPLADQLSSSACRYRQRSAPRSADLSTWPAAGAD